MLARDYRPQTFAEMKGSFLLRRTLSAIARDPNRSPRSIVISGPFGSGKCIPGSKRVCLKSGYKKIESLIENPKEGFNEFNEEIQTQYGWDRAISFYYERNCRVLNFRTTLGNVVSGTDKHRVCAIKGGKIDLFRMDSIEEGDTLLFSRRVFEGGSNNIDPLDAYWLGMLTGDGSFSDYVSFLSTSMEVVNEFKCRYSPESKITIISPRKEGYLAQYKVVINKGLEPDLFLTQMGRNSSNKFIPEDIFNSTSEVRVAYLRGIIDTDGCVYGGQIDICMKSKVLIDQLQELTLTLGMVSRISTKHCDGEIYYRIGISGSVLANSEVNWGVIGRKGIGGFKDSKNVRVCYPVNSDIRNQLREIRNASSRRYRRDMGSRLVSNLGRHEFVTRRSLLLFKDMYGRLPDVCEEMLDYWPVKVSREEDSIEDVYDLTVEKSHEFLAQGLRNHNTTAARIFAKAVNHPKMLGDNEPGNPVCDSIRDGSPLYMEIDSGMAGNVEKMRELSSILAYSYQKGIRVVVLDECHLISRQAQSAMLKVLEEAALSTFFVFATTDSDGLLDTIKSRSIEVEVEVLSEKDMVELLTEVSAKEKLNISEEVKGHIYRRSGGHPRNALQALNLVQLIGEEEYRKGSPILDDKFRELIIQLEKGDSSSLKQVIMEIVSHPLSQVREDFEGFLKESISMDKVNKIYKDVVTLYLRNHRSLESTNDWYLFLMALKQIVSQPTSQVVGGRFTKNG